MYSANGTTTEFPLPAGVDGSVVTLISPKDGATTRMQQGQAYTVQNGTVLFSTPPPAGWTVAFTAPATSIAKTLCTVIYPDGTICELDRDPYELLLAAKEEREAIRKALSEARQEREAATAEVKALAAEAKEALKSRLLNYDAKAEAAIAAAVNASEQETAERISKNMLEICDRHKEVMEAWDAIEMARDDATEAADDAAEAAGERLRDVFETLTTKIIEVSEGVLQLRTEIEQMRDDARNAAQNAAVETSRILDNRITLFATEANAIKKEVLDARKQIGEELKAMHEHRKKGEEIEERLTALARGTEERWAARVNRVTLRKEGRDNE
jgi:uncharacterized membrane protein